MSKYGKKVWVTGFSHDMLSTPYKVWYPPPSKKLYSQNIFNLEEDGKHNLNPKMFMQIVGDHEDYPGKCSMTGLINTISFVFLVYEFICRSKGIKHDTTSYQNNILPHNVARTRFSGKGSSVSRSNVK